MPRAILADTITCDVLNANSVNLNGGAISGGGGATVNWDAVDHATVSGLVQTGTLKVTDATAASSATVGPVTVAGGIGVSGTSYVTSGTTTSLHVGSSLNSTSTTTGALVVSGGAGVASDLYVGGKIVVDSIQGSGTSGGTSTGTLSIGNSPDVAIINIGGPNDITSHATTINIGGPNDTVVLSNVVNVTSTNTQIEQATLELGVQNPLTANSTALGQGLVFDYYTNYAAGASPPTTATATKNQGYIQVGGNTPGDALTFKAPSTAGVVTLTPGASASSILTTTGGQTVAGNLSTTGVLASTGGITATKGTQEDSDATKVTASAQVYSAGSLQVNGGIGVSKTVFIQDATDSSRQSGTSYGTGALVVRGGAYVGKVLRVGGGLGDQTVTGAGSSGIMVNNTMDATTTPDATTNLQGALTVKGGAYVSKFLQIGGASGDTAAGSSGIKLYDSTVATSSAGAIQSNGGVKALNLYLSQTDVGANTNPPYNGVATGYAPSIVTEGGAWIKKNLSVGTAVSVSNDQGNVYVTNDIAGFSDARLKREVVTIPDALGKVGRMRGVYYKKLPDDAPTRVGLIAQEVREVVPEAVCEFDGYLSVTYGNLVGLLIEAVKEQSGIIADLKARVEALEAK